MHNRGIIWLTEQDLNRLRHLIVDLTRSARGMQAGVDTLEEILDLGRIVPVTDIPADAVTMNSKVLFDDLDSGEQREVTIVYPDSADAAAGKVSVLSPVGTALLGLTGGVEAEMHLPHGRKARIRIRKVTYQPEASGEFSL